MIITIDSLGITFQLFHITLKNSY